MELTLPNRRDELPRVHDALDRFGREVSLPNPLLASMHVVLEEHLANIMAYGYPAAESGSISVRATVADQELHVEIEDDGRPFNPLEQPPPDLTVPMEDRPIGGLGIHFMRRLTDALDYRRDQGKNILTLRKRLN